MTTDLEQALYAIRDQIGRAAQTGHGVGIGAVIVEFSVRLRPDPGSPGGLTAVVPAEGDLATDGTLHRVRVELILQDASAPDATQEPNAPGAWWGGAPVAVQEPSAPGAWEGGAPDAGQESSAPVARWGRVPDEVREPSKDSWDEGDRPGWDEGDRP
jgi:hypothetical protein